MARSSPSNRDAFDSFCGVQVRVLPDFLMDHTLLRKDPELRLEEFLQRWMQLVDRFGRWEGSTFCLQFHHDPREGATRIFMLARPADPLQRDALQRDIEFALKAYSIVADVDDPACCQRLLTRSQLDALFPNPSEREEIRTNMEREFGLAFAPPLPGGTSYLVNQEVTGSLWSNARLIQEMTARMPNLKPPGGSPPLQAWLPMAFKAPAGSFQVPFKALAASPSPATISIFLQPTRATVDERRWIESIGVLARNANQERRDLDPAAEPVERLCTRFTGSVIQRPFLMAVLCSSVGASSTGDSTSCDHHVESLAQTMQAIACQRGGSALTDPRDPPTGAAVLRCKVDPSIVRACVELEMPLKTPQDGRPAQLARLGFLCDAAGAATLFRLPVSTNGGICGVGVRQPAPTFVPGPGNSTPATQTASPRRAHRRLHKPIRTLSLGTFEDGGEARIDVEAFLKHCLITGFTGSGKSTSIFNIIHSLWHLPPRHDAPPGARCIGPNGGGIPVLVIESAKTEYRGLLGIPTFRGIESGLLVYTLGDETVAPLRFNPFALMPGVRVESHINRLQACFVGALPPLPWLPGIITEAMEAVYKSQWWTLTDVYDPAVRRGRRFPRFSDFFIHVERVLKSRGYVGDISANVTAATLGRLKQLTLGSIGFMFDVQDDAESIAPERLFNQPVILELDKLNVEDKALVMMFLLTMLREYRELHPTPHLSHLTIVEEAHNVLSKVKSQGTADGAGSDVRAKSVEAFCQNLAELRALGEGLIVADQSPNRLAEDLLRNTNVQLSHQLRDSGDREAIAAAMICDDEQRDFLAKLEPGEAAVFYTGLQRATFLTAPNFRAGAGANFAQQSNEQIRDYMRPLTPYRRPDVPFAGCQFCGKRKTCDHRRQAQEVFADPDTPEARAFAEIFNDWRLSTEKLKGDRLLETGAGAARTIALRVLQTEDTDAAWCLFLHAYSRNLNGAGGEPDLNMSREFSKKHAAASLSSQKS